MSVNQNPLLWLLVSIIRSAQLSIAGIGLLLMGMSGVAVAQTPAPVGLPNLNLYTNGIVHASVLQPDGSVVFGGYFSQVNGVVRTNLARLKPSGDLDLDWNPGFDGAGSVRALANDGKGNIYVGYALGYIVKISGTGSGAPDPTWGPVSTAPNLYTLGVDISGNIYVDNAVSPTGFLLDAGKFASGNGAFVANWHVDAANVRTIAVDTSDNVYIGGHFTQVNGQSRKSLAKVSAADGSLQDASWNPSPDVSTGPLNINALLPDNHGNLYVGGVFSSIGGQTRANIAKLSTSGTGAADPEWNPLPNGPVNSLALNETGNLFAGGSFTTIGGQTRYNLAKLSTTTGSADPNWNASTDNLSSNSVDTLTALPNGSLYAGGFFSTIAGMPRHSFAAIGPNGMPGNISDTVLPGGSVNAIAVQPNGGVIVGGYFSGAGDALRSNVLRLQPDGSLDTAWSASTDSPNGLGVEAVAVDSQNNVYLGGGFTQVGGQARTGIAKILADGSIDRTWGASTSLGDWSSNTWFYGVEALAIAANGDIYLGGDFNSVGGQNRLGLAKISGGAVDPAWAPPVVRNQYGIRSIALDSDGSVFVGGDFFSIDGQPKSSLAKLAGSGNGGLDATWQANVFIYGCGRALTIDGHGAIYTGCVSSEAGERTTSGPMIVKFATSGAGDLDANWQTHPYFTWLPAPYSGIDSAGAYALTVDSDGNLYVGGRFISTDGLTRPNLVKISTAGVTTDVGWNPGANDIVNALALDGKGQLYAGGAFTQLGLAARAGVVALPTADDAHPTAPGNLNQHGWTGAWYDPTASGQGFVLETFPDSNGSGRGNLFSGWFTYANRQGTQPSTQQWLTLQGPIDATGNSAALGIYSTVGGYLNSTQTKPQAGQTGIALMTFTDCTHANLAFHLFPTSPTDYFGQDGFIALNRLDANVTCSVAGDTGNPGNYLLSGAWYTPATSGQGFMFDINPVQNYLFAAWYAFNADTTATSTQHWYTLQSPFAAGVTSLSDLPIFESTGGFFATPSAVSTVRVGTSTLTFTSCTSASLSYVITDGVNQGASGTIALTRTGPTPVGCAL